MKGMMIWEGCEEARELIIFFSFFFCLVRGIAMEFWFGDFRFWGGGKDI